MRRDDLLYFDEITILTKGAVNKPGVDRVSSCTADRACDNRGGLVDTLGLTFSQDRCSRGAGTRIRMPDIDPPPPRIAPRQAAGTPPQIPAAVSYRMSIDR